MPERLKTLVGVPFYDGEGVEVLDRCIDDIAHCLTELDIDSEIVVGINGPRVSLSQTPLSRIVDRSKYSTSVKFIKTLPGIVKAEQTIGKYATEKGYQRIFLTDADISRLPDALRIMWNEGDKPVVGAHYATYPLEIMAAAGVVCTPQEAAYASIFEADKHPIARQFTQDYRPKRLKGSLLLVETGIINSIFGPQNITTDSQMNRIIPESQRQLVQNAAFMHYPRTNLVDHIKARLRHYKAADAVNDLNAFSRKSVFYSPWVADDIATKIRTTLDPNADKVASDFLLQSALREKLSEISSLVISKRSIAIEASRDQAKDIEKVRVDNYREAYREVSKILSQIDWGSIDCQKSNGRGVTQDYMPRTPIDLTKLLDSPQHRQTINYYLGLN